MGYFYFFSVQTSFFLRLSDYFREIYIIYFMTPWGQFGFSGFGKTQLVSWGSVGKLEVD